MSKQRRVFLPYMRMAAAIAGVGIALGGLWYVLQQGRGKPDEVVARAYSERRPFGYRITGGGTPGPIQIERSWFGLTNAPPALVHALTVLNGEASRRPRDSQVLSAAAQARLVAFELDPAQELLERARRQDPADDNINVNLATALALRSERVETGEPGRPLMTRSLHLLDEVLKRNASNTVARFNRALVLKSLGRDSEATAELARCLRDEPDTAWREEIQRQLNSLHQ
jgi:tetratricopeptide (TPR) repeat protein